MIEIRNECADAPLGLEWHVRRSLRWHDPSSLEGLASIRLLDEAPEFAVVKSEAIKRAKREGFGVYGLYCRERGGDPASIMLFVRDIYGGIPSYYWWSPIPTLRISRTLSHEVAHHLNARRGFIFRPGESPKDEESLASQYANSVLSKMVESWYYRLGRWKLRNIAMAYYVRGMSAWQNAQYKEAAAHWHRAWDLNRELKEAAYWYWRAKDMSDAGSKSAATDRARG